MNGIAYLWKRILNYFHTIIGTEPMGTTATTVKGAIAEHENDITDLTTVETYSPTIPSTISMSALYIRKIGNIVSVVISNPRKLAVGDNTICTLPVGWRPPGNVNLVLIGPTGVATPNGYNLSFRLTISPTGSVGIYNYRSTAINNVDTNQSGTITYIATQ